MPNSPVVVPATTEPIDRLALTSSNPRGADPATDCYVARCFADD